MKRTTEQWIEEIVDLEQAPIPNGDERTDARAREMAQRRAEIALFLAGDGPEPEWPWKPEHPSTPEERERDRREWAEYVARNW